MFAVKSLPQIKLIVISALFFSASLFLSQPIVPKRSNYLPPPVVIKNMSVGLNYQIADLLWLRALQDFDYCESKVNETECNSKSWLFQTLNLMTEMDPKIEPRIYRIAGLALTVIISDYAGASIIFDKAVKAYPKDWSVSYAAAYHALYEEKNKMKAAKLYEMAAQNGAPAWVFSLAGRLAVDEGADQYAESILQGMIATNQDEKIIKRLKDKMAEALAAKIKK